MSDQLAKQFDQHLSRALGNDNSDRRRLNERGWKDFVNSDYPDTNDPVVMVVAAICYIGLDGDGCWRHERRLMEAALAFMNSSTTAGPNEELLPDLGEILMNGPVDRDDLEQWFRDAYHI